MGGNNWGNSSTIGLNVIFNLSDYICSASYYIRNKYVHIANNADEYDINFFMYVVSTYRLDLPSYSEYPMTFVFPM